MKNEGLRFVKCDCGATAVAEVNGRKEDVLFCHQCANSQKK